MSINQEFIDHSFTGTDLREFIGEDESLLRYLKAAKVAFASKPAPTFHSRSVGLWFGTRRSKSLEIPTIAALSPGEDSAIGDEGTQWFVGAPNVSLITTTIESVRHSVEPRHAAMLTLAEASSDGAARAMHVLRTILPPTEYGLDPYIAPLQFRATEPN